MQKVYKQRSKSHIRNYFKNVFGHVEYPKNGTNGLRYTFTFKQIII